MPLCWCNTCIGTIPSPADVFCSPAPELCHLIRSLLDQGTKFELRSPPSEPWSMLSVNCGLRFRQDQVGRAQMENNGKEFICPFPDIAFFRLLNSFQAGTV